MTDIESFLTIYGHSDNLLNNNILLAYITSRNSLSSSLFIALEFSLALVYLNSSLNPVLYCWKIGEVRQAVKDTIKALFYCSSI